MSQLMILLCGAVLTCFLLEISCEATIQQERYQNTTLVNLYRNDVKPSWKKGEELVQPMVEPSLKVQTRNRRTKAKKAHTYRAPVHKHKKCICSSACDELNKFPHGCPKSCHCKQQSRIEHVNQGVSSLPRFIDFPISNQVQNAYNIDSPNEDQASTFAKQQLQLTKEPIVDVTLPSTSPIDDLKPDNQDTFSSGLNAVGEVADNLLEKLNYLEDTVRNNTDEESSEYRKKRRTNKARAHSRKTHHNGRLAKMKGSHQPFSEIRQSRGSSGCNTSDQGNMGYGRTLDKSPAVIRPTFYETPPQKLSARYADKDLHNVRKIKKPFSKASRQYYTSTKDTYHAPVLKNYNHPKTSVNAIGMPFKTMQKPLSSFYNYQTKDYLHDKIDPEFNSNEYNLYTTAANATEPVSTFFLANSVPLITNMSEVIDLGGSNKIDDNLPDINDKEVIIDTNFPTKDGIVIPSKPKRSLKSFFLGLKDSLKRQTSKCHPPFLFSDWLTNHLKPEDKHKTSDTEKDLKSKDFISRDTNDRIPPQRENSQMHSEILDEQRMRASKSRTTGEGRELSEYLFNGLIDTPQRDILPMYSNILDEQRMRDLKSRTTGEGRALSEYLFAGLVDDPQKIQKSQSEENLPTFSFENKAPLPSNCLASQTEEGLKPELTQENPVDAKSADYFSATDIEEDITPNSGDTFRPENYAPLIIPNILEDEKSRPPSNLDGKADYVSTFNIQNNNSTKDIAHRNVYNRDTVKAELSRLERRYRNSNNYANEHSNILHNKASPENEIQNEIQNSSTSFAKVFIPQDVTLYMSDNYDEDNTSNTSLYPDRNSCNDNLKSHVDNRNEKSYPFFDKGNLLGRAMRDTREPTLNTLSKTRQLHDPENSSYLYVPKTPQDVNNVMGGTRPQANVLQKLVSPHRKDTLRDRNVSRASKKKSFRVNPLRRDSLLMPCNTDIPQKKVAPRENSHKVNNHIIPAKRRVYQGTSPTYKRHMNHVCGHNASDLCLTKSTKENLPVVKASKKSCNGKKLRNVKLPKKHMHKPKLHERHLHKNTMPKTVKPMGRAQSYGPDINNKLVEQHLPSYNDYQWKRDEKLHRGNNNQKHNLLKQLPITENLHKISLVKASKHKYNKGNFTQSNQAKANKHNILDRQLGKNLPYHKEYDMSQYHEENPGGVYKYKLKQQKPGQQHVTPNAKLHKSGLSHKNSHIIQKCTHTSSVASSHPTKKYKQTLDNLPKDNVPYLKKHGFNSTIKTLQPATLKRINDHKLVGRHLLNKMLSPKREHKFNKTNLHKKHSQIIKNRMDTSCKSCSHSAKNCTQIIDDLLKENLPYLRKHGLYPKEDNLDPGNMYQVEERKLVKQHLHSNISHEFSKRDLDKTRMHKNRSHVIQECREPSRRSFSVQKFQQIIDQLLKENLPYVEKFELKSKKVRLDRESPSKNIEREQALEEDFRTIKADGNSEQQEPTDNLFGFIRAGNNNLNDESTLDSDENDDVSYRGSMGDEQVPKTKEWLEMQDRIYTLKAERWRRFHLHDKQKPVNASDFGECSNLVNGTVNDEVSDAGKRIRKYEKHEERKIKKMENEMCDLLHKANLALEEDAVPTNQSTGQSTKKTREIHEPEPYNDNGWMWTPWTNWSPCSVTCGKGRSTRHRKCVVDQCKNGTEEELHERTCQMPACGLKGFFGLFT